MPSQGLTIGPGVCLGPYRILASLGAGGMGEVYKALDTKLEREVAVKVLPALFTGDRDRVSRFEREAKALAALNHPNILSIHDFGREGDITYSVTELLEGQTLRAKLGPGPLDVAAALRIAHQIAEGLAAAHGRGVVHRDLKPANVVVTAAGHVKILDFGLAHQDSQVGSEGDPLSEARTASDSTRPGTVLGTVGYMAPEQVRGLPADPRADIFALGVILYEMLGGRAPFKGNSDADVLASILTRDPPPLSRKDRKVPPAVEQVVRRCLQKDPAARFQSARDVAFAIEGAASGTSGFFVLPQPGWRRMLWPALVAAAVVVIAAAVIAGWMEARARGGNLPPFEPRQITSQPGTEGEPAISPDGTSVAYLSGEADRLDLWVADLRGGTPIRLTSDGTVCGRAAWYPDGSALLFPSRKGGKINVWKVPRFGGAPGMAVPDANEPAVSPDGTRVAFVRAEQNADYRIWVVPLGGEVPPRRLTSNRDGTWDHERPAWSPDGKSICYQDQNNLWLVPSGGGPARPLTQGEACNRDPVWSPDGRVIYFDSYRSGPWAIWRIGSDGRRLERVTLGTGSERFASLSADGRRMVYATTGRWLCALVDRSTGARRTLPVGYMALEPAFAPDGKSFAFVSDREGGNNLWIMPLGEGLSTGEPQRLTDTPGNSANLCYSPDGRWIAYHRVLGGRRDVWVVPSSGGFPVNFTDSPALSVQPEWRPDGTMISYLCERDGSAEVWGAPFEEGRRAGEPRQLTHAGGKAGNHCWSQDGQTLAYIVDEPSGGEVWAQAADGSTPPRKLTTNAWASLVTWDRAAGAILVLGCWGGGLQSVRAVKLDGSFAPIPHATASAPTSEIMEIEASPDGRLFLIVEEEKQGDIWALDAKRGSF